MLSIFKKDECAKEYSFGDELGRGSFAIVKRAVHRKDKSVWAIKCIEKSKLDRDDEEALRIEVEILERVNHPNIVKLRQCFDTPKVFYMVMELMTGGELFDRIIAKGKYSEREAASVIYKIADALNYCHKRGIVHRDLKPENILYKDDSDEADIRIADFGLAKLLNKDKVMVTACGTPGYVAPEILEGQEYSEKVDCWSLGVILYIILCGFPPFYDENNAALFAQIKSGSYDFPSPYWDDVSASAVDLVRRLLVVDPRRRLSAEGVLKHPWVADGGSSNTLASAFENLKKFNARRRFRQGVRKVMAANAFARFGKLSLAASAQQAAEELLENGGFDAVGIDSTLAESTQDTSSTATHLHPHSPTVTSSNISGDPSVSQKTESNLQGHNTNLDQAQVLS